MNRSKSYPTLFRHLFVYQHEKRTVDIINDVFQVKRSVRGSNKFKRENILLSYWNEFLIDVEEGETELSLEMILGFAAGCREIPSIGFTSHTLSISFLHEKIIIKSQFPKANTFIVRLYLPTTHFTYNEFRNAMVLGILNTKGFGYS